jgi:hypothetical protein
MRNKLTFLILIFISLSIRAQEIEWEKVEGADFYQIEVMNSLGEQIQKLRTKETKAEIKNSIPGKYKYRIGAADNYKRFSWTNWIDFRVEVFSEKSKEKIRLEWEMQKVAEKYKIQVVNESGRIIYEEKLNSNKTFLSLGIGKYKYKVASINELGNEAWSDYESFEVKLKTWEIPNTAEKKNWASVSDQIDRIDLCSVRCNVFRRSLIFPGWGQNYREDRQWRVYSYPILLSSLLYAYFTNHEKNKSAQSGYNSALNLMILSQVTNSESANMLTYYSYSKILEASGSTKETYAAGNKRSFLVLGIYFFNLIDAYFFYDYTVPISERYNKPKLSIQFFKSTNSNASAISEYSYEIKYGWIF